MFRLPRAMPTACGDEMSMTALGASTVHVDVMVLVRPSGDTTTAVKLCAPSGASLGDEQSLTVTPSSRHSTSHGGMHGGMAKSATVRLVAEAGPFANAVGT